MKGSEQCWWLTECQGFQGETKCVFWWRKRLACAWQPVLSAWPSVVQQHLRVKASNTQGAWQPCVKETRARYHARVHMRCVATMHAREMCEVSCKSLYEARDILQVSSARDMARQALRTHVGPYRGALCANPRH